MKFFRAELEDRIEVAVEHNRDLRLFSNLTDAIEHTSDRRPGFERTLSRELINNSIRQWIREWKAEFEQIGARLLERESKIDCAFEAGVTGTNVGDKAFAFVGAELFEAIVDPIFHE